MKHNLGIKALSLLLAIVCLLSLAACGGGDSPAGTYKLTKMNAAGVEMDLEQLAEQLGVDVSDMLFSATLQEDGTFIIDGEALGMSMEGTWKQVSGGVDLPINAETITATIKGGELTMEQDGMSLTFKK